MTRPLGSITHKLRQAHAVAVIAVVAALLAVVPAASAASTAQLTSAAQAATAAAATHAREHTQAARVREHTQGVVFVKTKPVPARKIHGENAIVHRFNLHLLYCFQGCRIPIPSGKFQLAGFEMSPIRHGDFITGGCLRCSGHGKFTTPKVRHHLLVERIKGRRYMDSRTQFVEGIIRAGSIGRIEGYAVRRPPLDPKPLSAACLGADTLTNAFPLIEARKPLPIVSCNQRTPNDRLIAFVSEPERSATGDIAGAVATELPGPRWVSVFNAPPGGCRTDAQGQFHKFNQRPLMLAHASGGKEFKQAFLLPPGTTTGEFCMFVQTGGLYNGIPDGRVTSIGDHPYWAGDSVSVSVSPTATANQQLPITVTGHASRREGLWLFASTSPCLPGANTQAKASYGVFTTPVQGDFSQTITSTPVPSSSFVCAYLQTDPSQSGATHPMGVSLVGTSAPVTVTPATTAAQAQRLKRAAVRPSDGIMLPTHNPLSVSAPALR